MPLYQCSGKKPLRLNLTRSFIHWLIKRQEAKSAGSPTTTLGRLPPRKPNKMAKWQVLPSLILLAHIEHLPVNFLLHHNLNDDHHLQIALLASSVSIDLVSSSARVTSAKSQPKLPYGGREAGTHRPDPRDTWVR